MSTSAHAITRQSIFKLLAGSVCISFSPVFIKLANTAPDAAGFYRMFFAGVSLFLLMLLRRQKLSIPRRPRQLLCLAGIFLSIDFMCWHRSIELVGPGLSTLLGNFQVFFTALFSWLFFRQKITPRFLFAVVMAFCGLAMITGLDFGGLEDGYQAGILFGLMTALFYSCYIMLVKSAMDDVAVASVPAMLIVAITSSLVLSFVTPLNGQSFLLPGPQSLFALIGAGVVSTTIGWTLISSGIKVVQATVASLVLLLQPTLAMVWDTLFFARPTSLLEFSGVTLILAGIYIGTSRR